MINNFLVTKFCSFIFATILGLGPALYFLGVYFDLTFLCWLGSFAMGILISLILTVIGFEISNKVLFLYDRFFHLHVTILHLAQQVLFYFWFLFLVAYLVIGLWSGLLFPTVKEVLVKVKELPFPRLKIVMLSDMHLGPTFKESFTSKCVEEVNKLSPDIVIINGDLVDQDLDAKNNLLSVLAPLKNLQSKYGTYMVMGNHEYYNNPQAVLRVMPSLNIKVLLNESAVVGTSSQKINLIGLADYSGIRQKRFLSLPEVFKPSLVKALQGRAPQFPSILLTHQPKQIELLNQWPPIQPPIDLVLSGHTHGGQVFPFQLAAQMEQKFLQGLYSYSNKNIAKPIPLYVSAGTGRWGPPMRVGSRSEITLFILEPDSKHE